MSSIIEEIAAAEERAAKLRQEAVQAGKEAALAAQAEADAGLAAQADADRAALREATQKAEAEGAALSAGILQERAGQARAESEAARQKLPEAVDYLLGRVVSTE